MSTLKGRKSSKHERVTRATAAVMAMAAASKAPAQTATAAAFKAPVQMVAATAPKALEKMAFMVPE